MTDSRPCWNCGQPHIIESFDEMRKHYGEEASFQDMVYNEYRGPITEQVVRTGKFPKGWMSLQWNCTRCGRMNFIAYYLHTRCHYCKTKLPPKAIKCPNCGAKV